MEARHDHHHQDNAAGIWNPIFLSELGSELADKARQLIESQLESEVGVCDRIGPWADLGLSLRQMQAEIGEQIGTQMGLRTLNEQVQAVSIAPAGTGTPHS